MTEYKECSLMALYLLPPSGSISYERLTSYTYHRFHFLLRLTAAKHDPVKVQDILLEESTVAESECLIEGTKKDRISHFLLRLACCGDRRMSEFLLAAETLLFQLRFHNMNANELVRFLTKSLQTLLEIIRNVQQGGNINTVSHQSILPLFHALCNILQNTEQIEKLVKLYLEGDVANVLEIPFYYVLDLVKSREVTLKSGMAFVSVSKLGRVMTEVFRLLLERGLESARDKHDSDANDDDERVNKLFHTLKRTFNRYQSHRGDSDRDLPLLSHTDVDQKVDLFPACMQMLHRTLRENHRLAHHARIQYTLFLKESGLPLHEALMFWRHEYSQACTGQHGCHHTWQKDERRYTYNIRHLYGLEGSRINYRSHSCVNLQQCISTGAGQSGGCPFANSDEAHLKVFLSNQSTPADIQEEILSMSKTHRYTGACNSYLHAQIRKRSEITKPYSTDEIQTRTDMLNRNANGALKMYLSPSVCGHVVGNHRKELFSCRLKRKLFITSENSSREKQSSLKTMRHEELVLSPHRKDRETIGTKSVNKHLSASSFISKSVNTCSVAHSEFLSRNDTESGIGLNVRTESSFCESDTEIDSDRDLFEDSDASCEADFNSTSSEVKSVSSTKITKVVNRPRINNTKLTSLTMHTDSGTESQSSDHTGNDVIDNGSDSVSGSEEDRCKQCETHPELNAQKCIESRHLPGREDSDSEFEYDSETDLFDDGSSLETADNSDSDRAVKYTPETTYRYLSGSKDGGCSRQVGVKPPVLKNHHLLTLEDISCTNTSCYARDDMHVNRSMDVTSDINTDSQSDKDNVFNSNISVKREVEIDWNCNCRRNLINDNSFCFNGKAPRFDGTAFGERLRSHMCSKGGRTTSNANMDLLHNGSSADSKAADIVSVFLEKMEIVKPLDYYVSFQKFLKQLKESVS